VSLLKVDTIQSNGAVDVEVNDDLNVTGTLSVGDVDLAGSSGATIVGYNPTGTVAAGTVQDAIDEVVSDLAASTGSSLVGFAQSGIGARTDRTAQEKMRDIVSILDWVDADGTDETTEAQEAIDDVAAAGGGDIWIPGGVEVKCNVTLATGVILRGGLVRPNQFDTTSGRLTAVAAGAVVDTPVATTRSCGVIGLQIRGIGAATAGLGVHFRDVRAGVVAQCFIDNFSDEAILEDSSCIGCIYEQLHGQNCLLGTQSAKTGVFDFSGKDQMANNVEGTASLSALSDANAYLCGIVIRGSNGFYTKLIGEISDEGIHLTSAATLNRISDSRADLNFGHGWNVIGTSNQFSNCIGLNNSQETTNTYDNWNFSGSGSNQTSNCRALSNVAKVAKYGFNDTINSFSNRNKHFNPTSSGSGTAEFISTANGSSFIFDDNQLATLTANSATPSVAGAKFFTTANTNPTTITDFTGGVKGQEIIVRCADDNTTIHHNGSTISLFGSAPKKLRNGAYYRFINVTSWRELEEFGLGVTADVGDAAKTLTTRQSEETQIWATELTADRAVTLSTTGAYAGAKFHIARPAVGAFNLNVGTGPLKALAAGEWCEVTYSGSAWVLTKFGSL
jgi:hypothetical protein